MCVCVCVCFEGERERQRGGVHLEVLLKYACRFYQEEKERREGCVLGERQRVTEVFRRSAVSMFAAFLRWIKTGREIERQFVIGDLHLSIGTVTAKGEREREKRGTEREREKGVVVVGGTECK